MSKIKSRNTSLELYVRKFLFNKGLRYRVNYKITGRPDIVFPAKKIAIFINGCFWHKHNCDNSVIPKSNREFWKNKLADNVKRDKDVEKKLKREGWKVYKIWECEIQNPNKKSLDKMIKFIK